MKFRGLKKKLKAAYLTRRYRLQVFGDEFEIGKYCVFRRNDQARIILGRGFCARNYVSFNVTGCLEIGEGVFVNSYTSFNARVRISIGSGTLIGEGVRFYDHDHRFRDTQEAVSRSGFITAPIVIGNDVWLGSNAIILRGVTVGEGAVVAAGAVVSRNVPPYHLYFSKDRIIPVSRDELTTLTLAQP